MSRRVVTALAWVAVLATAATGVVAVALEAGGLDKGAVDIAWMAMLQGSAVIWSLVGALLVVKRPGNRLGWLLLLGSLGLNTGAAADRYAGYVAADLPYAVYVWALAGWVWVPASVALFGIVPLVFPTGHPLTPRWRWVGWFAAVMAAVASIPIIAMPLVYPDLVAAEAWDAPQLARFDVIFHVGFVGMLAAGVLAWISLAVRFHRSPAEERKQLKWLVFAMGLVVVHLVVFGLGPPNWIEVATGFVVMPSVAVAIGIAVLRYRLYDIDRVVSRTVSYGLLSVLLVGVYVAGVVWAGGLVRSATGGRGGDLAVAASTLAAAALFGPARHRIQTVVDRRFNRARYDAERTVEAFAQRLRDEVDLAALTEDLQRVVAQTVQPSAVGLWIVPASVENT